MQPLRDDEPSFASFIRVVRNKSSLADLIHAFPALEQKCLTNPTSLTDSERRLILDLPDADEEAKNIQEVTTSSREELLARARSDPRSLTDDEVKLLNDSFWRHVTRAETVHRFTRSTKEVRDRIGEAQSKGWVPEEWEAVVGAVKEDMRRQEQPRIDAEREAAQAALPTAPKWIQTLYKEPDRKAWGYVALYDAGAQRMDPSKLEDFTRRVSAYFGLSVFPYSGAKHLIDKKWKFLTYNAPKTAFSPGTEGEEDNSAVLRQAFHDLLNRPKDYKIPQGSATYPIDYGITTNLLRPDSQLLTNTFLVIDPICVESVLGMFLDNMRIKALEADYPVAGRTYAEGYQGWTWVRFEQIAYNFYEARMNDSIGMDEIWKASQWSRHQAFTSLDPEEAAIWTPGTVMGLHPDSILAKRKASLK